MAYNWDIFFWNFFQEEFNGRLICFVLIFPLKCLLFWVWLLWFLVHFFGFIFLLNIFDRELILLKNNWILTLVLKRSCDVDKKLKLLFGLLGFSQEKFVAIFWMEKVVNRLLTKIYYLFNLCLLYLFQNSWNFADILFVYSAKKMLILGLVIVLVILVAVVLERLD